jgi:hypothetical protein
MNEWGIPNAYIFDPRFQDVYSDGSCVLLVAAEPRLAQDIFNIRHAEKSSGHAGGDRRGNVIVIQCWQKFGATFTV